MILTNTSFRVDIENLEFRRGLELQIVIPGNFSLSWWSNFIWTDVGYSKYVSIKIPTWNSIIPTAVRHTPNHTSRAFQVFEPAILAGPCAVVLAQNCWISDEYGISCELRDDPFTRLFKKYKVSDAFLSLLTTKSTCFSCLWIKNICASC